MSNRNAALSSSRLPQLSRLRLPTVVTPMKRSNSGGDISCPTKKIKLNASNLPNGSSESLNRNPMPRPVGRPPVGRPKAPVGSLRRSVSMAALTKTDSTATSRLRPGLSRGRNVGTSKLEFEGRPSNVTAVTIQKSTLHNTGSRFPGTNITNRVNSRSNDKGVSTQSVNPSTAGKTKRAPWDLKGKLQDLECKLKENSSKMCDYDSRMAALEAEKSYLSQNLQITKTTSESVQEEFNELKRQLRDEKEERHSEKLKLERTIQDLEFQKSSLEKRQKSLEDELTSKTEEAFSLKTSFTQLVSSNAGLEARYTSTKLLLEESMRKNEELERILEQREKAIQDMSSKILEGESVRRKLHNMVQELKGNIRVFCRVRPLIGEEIERNGSDHIHHINFLDEKTLELVKNGNLNGSSISGLKSRNSNYDFSFDRVFTPTDSQATVFEEISQLSQSALDGYNVCVFAYGQTGSGKTFTMEGVYEDEVLEGMIPRTVKHIFASMKELEDKGWKYEVSASFLEIYNETIRDLLAASKETKNAPCEIKLMDGRKPDVYVTNLKVIPVEDSSQIHELLSIAQQHRAVAATNMNERSSRSHSVFRLKLVGFNNRTEESCEGTLNLVDLAGSERLKESGSEGARLTETQNINKSLANVGNVIMALAQKQNHIPYRNSKLTHLLQNSLGGNSKTLMFVNVSPLDACFAETLNSLRFATKVNQCQIGTAIKQVKK